MLNFYVNDLPGDAVEPGLRRRSTMLLVPGSQQPGARPPLAIQRLSQPICTWLIWLYSPVPLAQPRSTVVPDEWADLADSSKVTLTP